VILTYFSLSLQDINALEMEKVREIQIYNTLSRRKEVFEPVTPGMVGLYVCGPTV
jgi:hypothetical protein